MTGHQMPVSPLSLYECYWACLGASGTRLVWAHDEREAVRQIREHPSMFGLPNARPIVGRPTCLKVRETGELDLDAA